MENPYAELENKYANNLQQQNEMLAQQSQIQKEQSQANTNQTINEINQQKGYATQDFNKEAKGAYQDYQKTINPYGVQAEQMASNGLGNSGYSETSSLNAYNTYQNRYATAKTNADKIQQDFNNQIAQARLSGNKELAEIALNELNNKMNNLWNQLNLETTLTQNKIGYNQWRDEFDYTKQQNDRSYNQWLDEFNYTKQQNDRSYNQWLDEFNYTKQKDDRSYNQWLDEFNYNKLQDEIANAFAKEQFEYQKQQDALSRSSRSSSSSGSNWDFNNGGGSDLNDFSTTVNSTPKTAEEIAKEAVAQQVANNAFNGRNPLTGITLQDAVNFNKKSKLWK